MSKKDEVLYIMDDNGNEIIKKAYQIGNCLIDLLYGKAIMDNGKVVDIDNTLKSRIAGLLEQCDDYLHNDIKSIVENDMAFIFKERFSYQNVFVESKLCRVYFFDDIYKLICLLLTNIYLRKLMYKRCGYCNNLFATRYSKSKFCKRIATQSGKTCRYAYHLKMNRLKHIDRKSY